MKEILAMFGSLDPQEQRQVYMEMRTLMGEQRQMRSENIMRLMQSYMDRILAIMGLEFYSSTSRDRKFVTARIIIANILLMMGYTEHQVGEVMKKDHSTIHIYKARLDAWIRYPRVYKEEMNYYEKVLKEYETNKSTI